LRLAFSRTTPSSAAAQGRRNEVSAFVDRIINKASAFGVNSTGAVSTLAELAIPFSEHFGRSPVREWTLNILAHTALPGSSKTEAIQDRHANATHGRVMTRF
jgi:hypothetical protein